MIEVPAMLWYDDDIDRTLEERVKLAVASYKARYKFIPNLAYVHPTEHPGGICIFDEVEVRATRSILPSYIWIGFKEEQEKA